MVKYSGPLYKYTDLGGAKLIIQNKSLMFSSPNVLNDPFELQLGEDFIFDDETAQRFDENVIDYFIKCDSKLLPVELRRIHDVLIGMTHDQLEQIKREFKLNPEEFRDFRGMKDSASSKIQTYIEGSGILCFSKGYQDLLMWAHYADKHQGVVLEFKPNIEKDSILKLSDSVIYSGKRVSILRNPSEFFRWREVFESRIHELFLTKSMEWESERECRIYIPNAIEEGEKYCYQNFYADELVALRLGYKMEEFDKKEIIDTARRVNEDVKIFETKLDAKSYKLKFIPIL